MVIIRPNMYNLEKDVLFERTCDNNCERSTGRLGAAVDIGTTTIAISLFSIDNREFLGNITENNVQTRLGADVMMRIMHANMGKRHILHDMVIEQLENMLESLCAGKYEAQMVAEMTVVGNTTMCHLFLDKDVSGMSGAPFKTAYEGRVDVSGKDLGFKKYAHLSIHVISGVAAHIGADAVSVLCDQNMYGTDKIQLAIDIGTNAEIILNNKGDLTACSAAAGPAFEGKGVECGMRAARGAINGIRISKVNGNIILDVIDNSKVNNKNNDKSLSSGSENRAEEKLVPKGICGSGLVDIVAELLKTGALSADGYLLNENQACNIGLPGNITQRLGSSHKGNFFVVYDKIVITQNDIRNIQLAKAAIHAGVEVLLDRSGILLDDVDEIKIAGVFGKFIHPKSAVSFGLYPDVDRSKMSFVGNAAGNGAAKALLDENFRKNTDIYAEKIRHIELADDKEFQKKFLDAMDLREW